MKRTELVSALSTRVRTQRVVVDYKDDNGPEWWLMLHDGSVSVWDTSAAALKAISKAARRQNRGVTVTTIEWRNTPAGFVPPGPVKVAVDTAKKT